MAIDNTNVIDGMAIDRENTALRLLLTDHLQWVESADTISEHDHLLMLQEKVNAYISYIETEQFKIKYPDVDFKMAIIDIRFKYDITENCEKFLQAVQDQIGQYGIKIEARIVGEK